MPAVSLKERLAMNTILVAPAAFDNEMGFKLVAFAVSCLLVATKAMQRAMQVLREEGSTQAIAAEMTNFGEFNDLIGFPDVRSFETKYRI
jgi:2-methylisocitrate lyase-like PEP mutase family enzyme